MGRAGARVEAYRDVCGRRVRLHMPTPEAAHAHISTPDRLRLHEMPHRLPVGGGGIGQARDVPSPACQGWV